MINYTYDCVTSAKDFPTSGEYTAFINDPLFCCCVRLEVIQKINLCIAAALTQLNTSSYLQVTHCVSSPSFYRLRIAGFKYFNIFVVN